MRYLLCVQKAQSEQPGWEESAGLTSKMVPGFLKEKDEEAFAGVISRCDQTT
jgi:hypothetical protein